MIKVRILSTRRMNSARFLYLVDEATTKGGKASWVVKHVQFLNNSWYSHEPSPCQVEYIIFFRFDLVLLRGTESGKSQVYSDVIGVQLVGCYHVLPN